MSSRTGGWIFVGHEEVGVVIFFESHTKISHPYTIIKRLLHNNLQALIITMLDIDQLILKGGVLRKNRGFHLGQNMGGGFSWEGQRWWGGGNLFSKCLVL